jgi:hypothetical protein
MKNPWQFIKADQFFPVYCPDIKDYKRKISGRNGRGNPIEFSPPEQKQINAGLKQLFKDIRKR